MVLAFLLCCLGFTSFMAINNCAKCLFDQVNILMHTAEVPYETYTRTLKNIEKIRGKMKEQDLEELYGVSEFSTERDLSPTSTDSRNITVDKTSTISCNDGNCKLFVMVTCAGLFYLPLFIT